MDSELLTVFVSAKRSEGCSEKMLKYCWLTISKMLSDTNKRITRPSVTAIILIVHRTFTH